MELTEDEKSRLNAKLQELADRIADRPKVAVTYFQPDKKKVGGAYVCVTGQVEKINIYEGALVLTGGKRILIEEIVDVQLI